MLATLRPAREQFPQQIYKDNLPGQGWEVAAAAHYRALAGLLHLARIDVTADAIRVRNPSMGRRMNQFEGVELCL